MPINRDSTEIRWVTHLIKRALALVEQRERESLEVKLLKERRDEERERQEESRAPKQDARTRSDEFNEVAAKQSEPAKEAERVEGSGESGGEAGAGSNVAPQAEIKVQRCKRTRDREQETERSTRGRDRDDGGDDPSPDRPPRRRRDRDFGPER